MFNVSETFKGRAICRINGKCPERTMFEIEFTSKSRAKAGHASPHRNTCADVKTYIHLDTVMFGHAYIWKHEANNTCCCKCRFIQRYEWIWACINALIRSGVHALLQVNYISIRTSTPPFRACIYAEIYANQCQQVKFMCAFGSTLESQYAHMCSEIHRNRCSHIC